MYTQKSEIIKQIQSYHKQLSDLYLDLANKVEKTELKLLLNDLYQHEKCRYNYLKKHLKIAEKINSWLDVPYACLSEQISECFEGLKTEPVIGIHDIIKIEIHFDNCLIKLYNLLAAEDALNESLTNIFYYMLKKTKQEEELLSRLFQNAQNTIYDLPKLKTFSQLNYSN